MTYSGAFLELELFGGPRVRRPGGLVDLSPYQAALLALVYGHEDGLTRRQAAWLMWEADDDPRARQRIRQLLYALQSRLGARLVEATGDTLRPIEGAACDLARYRGLLGSGTFKKAAELLKAGFCSALTEWPSEEFDDWISAKAVALRSDLREAAARAWDRESEEGDREAARDAAEALYLLDPEDENAVRRVIEARASTGSIGAAEAAYASFVETLLGREHSLELADLIARVRSLEDAAGGGHPEPQHDAPLVGRQDALKRGREALSRIGAGSFEFVLLRGESGIGKTRVLEELRREARLGGFRCFSAKPVELERRIPLNPLLDALRGREVERLIRSLEDPWRAVLTAVFPHAAGGEAAPAVPPIQESSLSRRLLEAFAVLFQGLAEEAPTLLFIDDLQWADATTVTVLQFLQRRWEGGALGVVATVRPELVGAEDEVGKYLSGNAPATSVDLGELAIDDAMRLVGHVAGGHIDPKTATRICELGGRAPFYLVELTRDFVAGRLELPSVPVEAIAVPVSLQQLFEARIEQLSPMARRCVDVLAAWARPMRLSSLAAIAGLDLDPTADAVDELHASCLVRLERDTVVMAHELFRSSAYRHIRDARRAVLHRALAERLVATDGLTPGELAIHYAKAGAPQAASRYGRAAATIAFDSGAMAEAAYFYELVMENEEDVSLRADVTADLARVLHLDRQLSRASTLLDLASKRLRQVGNIGRALRMEVRAVEVLTDTAGLPVRALLERLADIQDESRRVADWECLALALDAELHLHNRAADAEAAKRVFIEMHACAAQGPPGAACICHMGLCMNVLFGDPRAALASAEAALALATHPEVAPQYELAARNRAIVVLLYQGRLALPQFHHLLNSTRTMARSSGDLWNRSLLELNVGTFFMDIGELDRAEEVYHSIDVLAGPLNLGVATLNYYANLAELHLYRGAFESAREMFLRAETLVANSPVLGLIDLINAGLGLCALETGDLTEAHRREEALSEDPSFWFFDPTVIVWFRARLLQRRGRLHEAITYLRAQADPLAERLVLSWLKLLYLEAPLARKGALPDAHARALAARDVAESLGLTVRAAQFAAMLPRN